MFIVRLNIYYENTNTFIIRIMYTHRHTNENQNNTENLSNQQK